MEHLSKSAVKTKTLLACGVISNAGLRLGAPTIDPLLLRADALAGIRVDDAVRAFARHRWLIDGLAWFYNASSLAVVAREYAGLRPLPAL